MSSEFAEALRTSFCSLTSSMVVQESSSRNRFGLRGQSGATYFTGGRAAAYGLGAQTLRPSNPLGTASRTDGNELKLLAKLALIPPTGSRSLSVSASLARGGRKREPLLRCNSVILLDAIPKRFFDISHRGLRSDDD